MRKAIFPGSFDPFTVGHYDIVKRGLSLFDHIVIAIGENSEKKTLFDIDQRMDIISQAFAEEKRISVDSYQGLTVDYAKAIGAEFILRGVRSVIDFEYERTIANTNKRIGGVETVVLYTETENSFISSTIVRDLIAHGRDIADLLPPNVMIKK